MDRVRGFGPCGGGSTPPGDAEGPVASRRLQSGFRLYVGTTGKMAYVYILKSEKNNKYYIGSTEDYIRRVKQHESGNVTFTRNIRPIKLALVQEYADINEARRIEKRLKKLKRKDYIDKIVKDGFIRMGP